MFDLVILGGGSAGHAAANEAIKLKKKVCIIDKPPFGGLCILHGCMPSKTLIHTAKVAELINSSKEIGITVSKPKFNIKKIVERKNKIIKSFANYKLNSLKKITLIKGTAKFISKNEVKVNNKIIKGKKFLVATGSKPINPKFEDLKKINYLTYPSALAIKSYPKSMAFLGAGPVSLELAYYFHNLGVKCTILQRSSNILSKFDNDISKTLEKTLKKKGIKIYTNTNLKKFYKKNNKKVILFNNKKLEVDEIFVGFGVTPNLDLDLEKADIKLKNNLPLLNKYLQSTNKNIFFAGDSTNIWKIVTVATEQGKVAVNNMFQKKKPINYLKFPMAVFTHPEIAFIGLTEKEAKRRNIKIKVKKVFYKDLGRAITENETQGFIKFILNKDKILGVSIIGHLASDIIVEAIPLLFFKATLKDLEQMQYIHPTFGEIFSYIFD